MSLSSDRGITSLFNSLYDECMIYHIVDIKCNAMVDSSPQHFRSQAVKKTSNAAIIVQLLRDFQCTNILGSITRLDESFYDINRVNRDP